MSSVTHIQRLRGKLYRILDTIENDEVGLFTRRMLAVVPDSFWVRRASREHHLEDERGEYGNLIHTIRVAMTTDTLCDIPPITGLNRDILTSAAILHDTCRYGLDDNNESTVGEHAQLVRQLAKREQLTCKYDDNIFEAIEAHMGRWGTSIYTPELSFNSILHIADVVCARVTEVLNKEEW